MQSVDIPQLTKELNALAELFGKNHLTPTAIELWFHSLKDLPADKVLKLLMIWPRTNTKFPAPADVWRTCNEELILERETRSKVEAAQNKSQTVAWKRTPQADAAFERMKQIVRMKTT